MKVPGTTIEAGTLAIELKTVPDIEGMKKIADRTGQDLDSFIKSCGYSFYPPLYRIVGAGIIMVIPSIANKRPVIFWKAVAGNEKKVLENIWTSLTYTNKWGKKQGITPPPDAMLVTFGGKRSTLPTIMARTLMYQRQAGEVPSPGSAEEHFAKGTKKFLNNEDKWENMMPNYTNRYSKFNIDISEDLSFGGRKTPLDVWSVAMGIEESPSTPGDLINILDSGDYQALADIAGRDIKIIWEIFGNLCMAKGMGKTEEHSLFQQYGTMKTSVYPTSITFSSKHIKKAHSLLKGYDPINFSNVGESGKSRFLEITNKEDTNKGPEFVDNENME